MPSEVYVVLTQAQLMLTQAQLRLSQVQLVLSQVCLMLSQVYWGLFRLNSTSPCPGGRKIPVNWNIIATFDSKEKPGIAGRPFQAGSSGQTGRPVAFSICLAVLYWLSA